VVLDFVGYSIAFLAVTTLARSSLARCFFWSGLGLIAGTVSHLFIAGIYGLSAPRFSVHYNSRTFDRSSYRYYSVKETKSRTIRWRQRGCAACLSLNVSCMRRTRKWLFMIGGLPVLLLAAYIPFPFFVRPPIHVPTSARWTRCSQGGFWLAYGLQVRFSAPYEDCLKTADEIWAHYRADANSDPGVPVPQRIAIKDGHYLSTVEGAVSEDGFAEAEDNKWWVPSQSG